MTFLRYITQRTGFGRTSWPLFAVIVAFIALWLGLSVDSYPEHLWWVSAAIAVLMVAVLVVGTARNYIDDKRRLTAPPNLNHYPDLCEGCDPPLMADGGRITDLEKWYAATRRIDRDAAWAALVMMTADKFDAIVAEHQAYLNDLAPKP